MRVLPRTHVIFIFFFYITLSFIQPVQAESHTITSPNGNIEITLSVDNKVNYSVSVDKDEVIKKSSAFISIDNKNVIPQKKIIEINDIKRKTINKNIHPHVRQKSKVVSENYNEITLFLNNLTSITFRVFDQGFGYRFSTQAIGDIKVENEYSTINFSENNHALFPEEESFISHNERQYLPLKLKDISQDRFASLPLLVKSNNTNIVITETGLKDYPGMWLKGNENSSLRAIFPRKIHNSVLKPGSDRNEIIQQRETYLSSHKITEQQAGRDFPWRVFAISQDDAGLLTNQLSYLLADDLAIDPSWIKPGQVAWDWWNDNNIYGVDFAAGINTNTYKYYIDFAAKYGIEYIVLDEGWHHLDNVLNVVEEINIQEIVDYGKSKNVDVILWAVWKTLEKNLETNLDEFAKWGVAGIKVDFMQRDDQYMVNYYWRVAEQAAKRHLLVDFHGSYKPAGLRRTYPNVITREGVRGLEHNKWADYISSEHNLTLPFIRQVAGPMDYTPGAMVNAQPENFNIVFNRPMSKTTRVHQMAMYVVFESPLQMLADSPSNYLKNDDVTRFITNIPTVWDETVILSAKIADHIITARKSGKDWFIGVMGNGQKREFNIDLSFLKDGIYALDYFADGANADRYASDYTKRTMKVSAENKIKINLAPNGGWVARISEL